MTKRVTTAHAIIAWISTHLVDLRFSDPIQEFLLTSSDFQWFPQGSLTFVYAQVGLCLVAGVQDR